MRIIKDLPERYIIKDVIKETKFSTSYTGFDDETNEKILVKFIPKDSIFYNLIYNDYMMLFQFKHPNFVQVKDFGIIDDKGLYYIMPQYEKIDPIKIIKEEKISFFLEVFFQFLCGLHFLHQRKKIHGNLNPNNVIISKENNKIRVRISDYVIASFINPKELISLTEYKEFIAPELITEHNASFTKYSDYYSLGVILFKMIYNTIPIDEYFIIRENNLLYDEKVAPLIDVDEGIIKIILKLLNKNPDFRYQNSQQILKDLMPYLKKYNIKEKKESFIWKNVLKEIRKNKQIELKFYGEKIIKDILSKISNDFSGKKRINLSIISANNSLDVKLITDYIYFSYKHDNIPVVKINNIPKGDFEKSISNVINKNISKSALRKSGYKILLMENCNDFIESQDYFFDLLKKYKDLKIIVGIDDNNCSVKKAVTGVKINYHKVKKLSNNEVKEYLKMYFGYGVLPPTLEEYLLYQSNRDLKILNQYIDFYIDNDIILYRNLKWYFRMELFDEKAIPNQIEKEISNKLKRYDNEIISILSIITFWKNNFTIKELSQISHSSILKVDTRVNLLKKHQLILQGKKFYSLYFPFLKVSLEKYLPENEKKRALGLILDYLDKKSNLSIEEKSILFDVYEQLDMKKELIKTALSIVDNSDDDETERKILKKIYNQKEKLEVYDKEKLYYLIIKYSWKLLELNKLKEAEEIYEFLKDKNLDDFVGNLADMFKIIYSYHLLNHGNYSKIIDELENYNEMDLEAIDKIRLLKILAEAYDKLGDYNEEKKVLNQIVKMTKFSKDSNVIAMKINAKINLAKIEARTGDIASAYATLNDINLKTKKNPLLSVEVYSYLARLNIQMKKLSSAGKNLKAAENILNKIDLTGDTRLFWEVKSIYLFLTGNYWQSLLSNNKAFVQYLKRNIFNFNLYVFKIIILLRIGFYTQALSLITEGLKRDDLEEKNYDNLKILENYVRFLQNGVFEEYKDIISIIKSKMELPYDYYHQHFKYLKNKNDYATLKKVEKLLFTPRGKNIEKYSDILLMKIYYYYSTEQLNKALNILNKVFKTISPINDYSEFFNYLAYKIKKEAFQENITIDDYKKYLKKARLIIQRKTELLPNDYFKSVYLKQNLISSIIYYYKVDIIGSVEITGNSDFLDTIEEMTRLISKLTDRKKLFTEILKLALRVSKTERGIIYTYDSKEDKLNKEYFFQFSHEALDAIKGYIENVFKKVVKSKEAMFQTQLKEFEADEIKSVISIPLIIHNNVVGLVYLDSKNLISFTPEEIKFLNIFAHLAGSALETSNIYSNLMREKEQLSLLIKTPDRFFDYGLMGNSPAMLEVFKKIEKVSKTNVNVLIQGESGTGKELVAKAIYQTSLLNEKPYIPVDCGSLSDDIIESELFGHVKGAFTSAYFDKKGLFEEANGGTIFLDEISNISLSMQAKLLRVLQEGEIKRIGENTVRKVNVRVIAASNIDLKELVKEGKFREDLYFRLSTFPIFIPPLRERKEDIKILTVYFVNYYSKIHKKNVSGLTAEAYNILSKYDWPGNVRELKNELERAVILYNGTKKLIDESYFEHLIQEKIENFNGEIEIGNFNDMVNQYKIKVIESAYLKSGKNWTKTAKLLGISRQNLNQIYKRLKHKD